MRRRKSAPDRSASLETAATGDSSPSPREKYDDFARGNGRVREEVEEALSELDKLAAESEEEE
jgi:hypothetical protein